ncbi:MAG: hypothetical protein GC164_11670 [Phycisphaera sp.]|nr:hypothetical protein [Phycisphaera sp.]
MSKDPTQDTQARTSCPSCGKSYRVTPQFAGKRVECRQCHTLFVMPGGLKPTPPTTPSKPARDKPALHDKPALTTSSDEVHIQTPKSPVESYTLDADDRAQSAQPRAADATSVSNLSCPSCLNPVKPTAVICVSCGFNLKTGKRLNTQTGRAAGNTTPDTHAAPPPYLMGGRSAVAKALDVEQDDAKYLRIKNLYVPLILITVGVALILLNAFVIVQPPPPPPPNALSAAFYHPPTRLQLVIRELFTAFVGLVIQLPFMFIAILVIAKLLGTAFGNIFVAIFKLLAMCVALAGLSGCLTSVFDILFEGMGFLAIYPKFVIYIIAFWAMATALFDTDVLETALLFVISWFLPYIVGGFLIVILLSLFS